MANASTSPWARQWKSPQGKNWWCRSSETSHPSNLIIKTPLTKPYTSVFFQLECGYWNAEAEERLREAIQAAE
jgi:hypothetical protein